MASTEETRQRIALNDLAKKIRLESQLKLKMNKLFRKIGRDLRSQFVMSGNVLNADQFKDEITRILETHYNRVFKSFNNSIIDDAKSFGSIIEVKQVEESITNRANQRFAQRQSETQAQKITDTNQKRINAAIAAALLALQQQESVTATPTTGKPRSSQVGRPVLTEDQRAKSRNTIARAAQTAFLVDANSRATATSITETQNPAETSKANQIDALVITGAVTAFNTSKVWTAILDDRVRDAHAIADGQKRDIGEPFEVNGELLRHPGDTSLGASASNVINCRCSSSLQFL